MLKQVVEIISEELLINKKDLTATTRLKEDLNVDSLDVVELVMDLEAMFNVRISDEEAASIKTIEDIVKLVESYQ
ncbi:MAG: acyl carrier protein [Acholeplasmataceae bacterium]|nr:acyl carrier protein [Acholeplasmataceae bacterium]